MRLLEVIRADQTGEAALGLACEVGRAMGKRVILVADGPGLLVNRCGRPYGAEALRLLQEGVAGHPKACASGAVPQAMSYARAARPSWW